MQKLALTNKLFEYNKVFLCSSNVSQPAVGLGHFKHACATIYLLKVSCPTGRRNIKSALVAMCNRMLTLFGLLFRTQHWRIAVTD